MNYTYTNSSLFIFLVLISQLSSSIVLAIDVKTTDQNSSTSQIGSGFINGDAQTGFFTLLSFLQTIGLDISYGHEGETVFSMIDYSLSKIIRDLSSGNASGIRDNPLSILLSMSLILSSNLRMYPEIWRQPEAITIW